MTRRISASAYLGRKNAFGTALAWAGQLFLCFETAVVIINFFRPVLFWFDSEGRYFAGTARYVTLAVQILLFFLTSVYTLWTTAKTEGAVRHRHLTIGLFGVAMGACIAVQVFDPLLPFYSMGYMLGTCLLHSFVMEDDITGMVYSACVVPDATACCAQGIEFVRKGEHPYPEAYPELGSELMVTGRFETYMEGENMFIHLVDADVNWGA